MNFKFENPKIKTAALFLILYSLFAQSAHASETSGTVVSGGNSGYAWSNQAGWVNFGCSNCGVSITDSGVTGYAWNQNYGWINMAPSNGGVSIAANGALSGYAWGSSLGWINFSGVSINSSGKFTGQATGANIGTLTFDCANCSVTTDFRPQNSRTVITPVPSGTDSGPIAGSGVGATAPSHLNAFNVPLEITRSQSGTLSRAFTNNTRVVVSVPAQASSADSLRIEVDAKAVSSSEFSRTDIGVVSDALFEIVARDSNNKLVHQFSSPIQISLIVPETLQGRIDLGVYFLNEESRLWERVPNVEFIDNLASFSVDHLTLFGIFSLSAEALAQAGVSNLPQFITPFFEVPARAIEGSKPIGVFAPEETPEELEELLPEQLFDIRLLLDSKNVTRIIDLVARVTFESFGRVPTSVDMTFTLLDEEGNELWTSVDKVTVETDQVFIKRFFDTPELSAGNYTLRLHTLYNTVVEDDFEATFTITPEEARSYWILWLLGLLVIALMAIFGWEKQREKDKYHQ